MPPCSGLTIYVCSTEEPSGLGDKLELFMFQHLLPWLEVMSILKQSRMTIALLNHFHSWLQVSISPLSSLDINCLIDV